MKTINPAAMIIPVTPLKLQQEEGKFLLSRIRKWTALFMILLVLSGITAFPVYTELRFLLYHQNFIPDFALPWLMKISEGIDMVMQQYPYLLYGYDWLAYSHIIIALF